MMNFTISPDISSTITTYVSTMKFGGNSNDDLYECKHGEGTGDLRTSSTMLLNRFNGHDHFPAWHRMSATSLKICTILKYIFRIISMTLVKLT